MNRALFVACIALCIGAVVWGLSQVGGPAYARMEKNDRQRLEDLTRLAKHYTCEETQQREDGISPSGCGYGTAAPSDLSDPLTGAPYTYTQLADELFTVCATFEIGKEAVTWKRTFDLRVTFDGMLGCLRYKWTGKSWVSQV